MTATAPFEVFPAGAALGAEIRGVDLAADLSNATVAGLRQAWLEHLVLFFRDQPLNPAELLHFARRLGRPVEYPFVAGIEGYPEVVEVKKLEHETVNFGGIWHSDTTYLAEPPMASMLLAREVPPAGGDTLFANMYLAYDTLPEHVKAELDSLCAVNSSAKPAVSRTRLDRMGGEAIPRDHVATHPAVRTHPETGRRALFVNVAHTVRFADRTEVDSRELLEYLFEHQKQARLVYRFVWQPGSLALWDNRCTQHHPLNDYQGYRRVMHRVTLAGDRPR